MANEYKNCPKCHIINAPGAKRCECGYEFSKGEFLSDEEIKKQEAAKKQKNIIISIGLVILIAIFTALSFKFGILVMLAYSIIAVIVLLVFLYVFLKIKDARDRRRMGK